jgi:hypothetical protein
VDPTFRKMRIEVLRAKVAACQQDCSALATKSTRPNLALDEKANIGQLTEETAKYCDYLRYMLSLYEHGR